MLMLEFTVLTEEQPPVVLEEEESPSEDTGGLGGLTGVVITRGEADGPEDVSGGEVSMVTRFFDLTRTKKM